jgi:hypothetical protein
MTLTRTEVIKNAAQGTLLEVLVQHESRFLGSDNAEYLEEVAKAHNAGELDALALFTPEAIRSYQSHRLYTVQRVFSALIKDLETTAPLLLATIEQVMLASDNSPLFPIDALQAWCRDQPSRTLELIDCVAKGTPRPTECLFAALTSGAQEQRPFLLETAYRFSNEGSDAEKKGAISAFSQLTLNTSGEWDRLIQSFSSMLEASSDQVRRTILSTVVAKLKDVPSTHVAALHELITQTMSFPGPELMQELAYALAFSFERLPAHLAQQLLHCLQHAAFSNSAVAIPTDPPTNALSRNPTNTPTHTSYEATSTQALTPVSMQVISLLDIGLRRFIEAGRADLARTFLENIIERRPDIGVGHFHSVVSTLRDGDEQVLTDWIIRWLLSGEIRLLNILRDDLFDLGFSSRWFDIECRKFDLKPNDYGYLARKTIAVFFTVPKIMTSILVSLLRSVPAETREELESLLVDPVLVNYSATVREFLIPIAGHHLDSVHPVPPGDNLTKADQNDNNQTYNNQPSAAPPKSAQSANAPTPNEPVNDDQPRNHASPPDAAQESARRVIRGVDDYLAALQTVGRINELHPSERERQSEWQRRSDEMGAAMKQARANSPFHGVISESLLLYGTHSVSWVPDLDEGPPRRLEMPLTNVGHSIEIPREEVIDPLGLSFMLFRFTTETRPS